MCKKYFTLKYKVLEANYTDLFSGFFFQTFNEPHSWLISN